MQEHTNATLRSSLKARSNQDEQPFSEQNLAEQEGLDFHHSLIPIPHLPASICFAKKGISRLRVLEVEQTLVQRSSEGETPGLLRALTSACIPITCCQDRIVKNRLRATKEKSYQWPSTIMRYIKDYCNRQRHHCNGTLELRKEIGLSTARS